MKPLPYVFALALAWLAVACGGETSGYQGWTSGYLMCDAACTDAATAPMPTGPVWVTPPARKVDCCPADDAGTTDSGAVKETR